MKHTLIATNSTYDSYPFSQDVVLPDAYRIRKSYEKKGITLKEFAEDMLYWILPSFIFALMLVNHYRIYGIIGFSIVLGIIVLIGAIERIARKNRLLLCLLTLSFYFLLFLFGYLLAS